MDPAPRLACEQCAKRKIRCSKGSPCSACKNADLQCHTVQRPRLPRGKSGKARTHNAMLESRVARIEDLLARRDEVLNTSCLSACSLTSTASNMQRPNGSEITASGGSSRGKALSFIAPDFWSELAEEVYGLRETLENSEDEGRDENQRDKLAHDRSNGAGAILFQHVNQRSNAKIELLSPEIGEKLLKIYRQRVDSVYKVLHWPTVLTLIELHHVRPLDSSNGHSIQVLEWSIYFMVICTITNNEAKEMGLGDRPVVLQTYRSMVEDLFAKSSLLQTPDLFVLQAFVIFLTGLRTCLSGATTWTLIAIAVRAATALRLGEETAAEYSPFYIELRRRLLFAIGILDTHSALDRGTIPILPSNAFGKPPLNINDQDMSPSDTLPSVSSTVITEMTHTAMIYEAMICQRKLYELSQTPVHNWEQWPEKLELIQAFDQHVQSVASSIGPSTEPLHTLLKISGSKISLGLQLLMRRPPYRQPHGTVPPWDDFDVLDVATKVLEQHMQPLLPKLEPWAWKNWVQWHALAVVLAELTILSQGERFDWAYSVATKSFHSYARIIADSESGMLWKPIAKLMRRVQRIKQNTSNGATQNQLERHAPPLDDAGIYVETADMSIFQGRTMFDSSEWSFDPTATLQPTDLHDFSQPELDTTHSGNGTQWLAWDTFLHDIDLLQA